MPATVDVDAHDLVVTVSGRDRVWALKRALRVPLARVTCVLAAGHFWRRGVGRQFWLARRAGTVLVVDTNDPVARIVLEVPDPEADAARIMARR